MDRPPRAAKSHAGDEVKRMFDAIRRPPRSRSITVEVEDSTQAAAATPIEAAGSALGGAGPSKKQKTSDTDTKTESAFANSHEIVAPVPRRSMRGQTLGK